MNDLCKTPVYFAGVLHKKTMVLKFISDIKNIKTPIFMELIITTRPLIVVNLPVSLLNFNPENLPIK
jgi:hypothetical protein